MKSKILLPLIAIIISCSVTAQDAADIYMRLGKLREQTTVLYIAAHPDDENTRLITWLSKEKKCRTVYLSLTRGDGGQNLIGPELGVELGLIRTRELMAARAIDGGEQYFTRAYDFGFSKRPEETLTIWDREKVLEDIVRVIRTVKPDVIICRFPPDQRAGHGHHSSSAILAHEAFKAAADANRFKNIPEKGAFWKTNRIFWNTFNFGSNNTISDQQRKVDVGNYNPLIGKSYGELSAFSRSQHKSQGFGVPAQRGVQWEYFSGVDGDSLTEDLFTPTEDYYGRSSTGKEIREKTAEILSAFDFLHPEKSIPSLIQLHNTMEKWAAPEAFKKRKNEELEKIILDCIGVWAAVYTHSENYAVNDTIHATLQVISRNISGLTVTINHSGLLSGDTLLSLDIQKSVSRKLTLLGLSETTQPYWLQTLPANGMFTVPRAERIGTPWNPPATEIRLSFSYEGRQFNLMVPVQYKLTDPVRGEVYRPLVIQPVITGQLNETVSVFNTNAPRSYRLKLTSHRHDPDSVRILFPNEPNGWNCSIKDTLVYFGSKEKTISLTFTLQPGPTATTRDTLSIQFKNGKDNLTSVLAAQHIINYDHIPRITWFPPLQLEVIKTDVKTNTKKVLYIRGAGDEIPSTLRQLGIQVDEMDGIAMEEVQLKNYDAVITGIRAYNTDEALPQQYERIMNYIQNGGVFLVQYNTNSNLHPAKYMAPFPYQISRNRVTEEQAVVTIRETQHPVLNYPNKITAEDFTGWKQERGLYFASKIDSIYQRPLLMNDTGEDPQDGSLIIANYGKGRYIYTGLAFFRQLPAGVTGAIRLFANLIEKPTE